MIWQKPRVLDFLHHVQLSDSSVPWTSFLTFLSCLLCLAANQQCERHARPVAAPQGAEGSGAGLGDGHGQQRHQLQRQLHHTPDDICLGAPVLRVPHELLSLPKQSSCSHLQTARLLLFIFQIIMSPSIKTLQIKTQQRVTADGKASLCSNPHPGLMDTELLWLRYGLWTQRDIYGVQFLTSSI